MLDLTSPFVNKTNYVPANAIQRYGPTQVLGKVKHLPSAIHSHELIEGKPGAMIGVIYDVVERAGLIALGLALAGDKNDTFKKAVVSSMVIEVAVIMWQASS
jgi:hypothetical protein